MDAVDSGNISRDAKYDKRVICSPAMHHRITDQVFLPAGKYENGVVTDDPEGINWSLQRPGKIRVIIIIGIKLVLIDRITALS